MKEILWWVIVVLVSISGGWYVGGLKGAIYLAIVCIIGGAFLLFERKTHPDNSQ